MFFVTGFYYNFEPHNVIRLVVHNQDSSVLHSFPFSEPGQNLIRSVVLSRRGNYRHRHLTLLFVLLVLIIFKAADFRVVAIRRFTVIIDPLNFHSPLSHRSWKILVPEWRLYRIIILLTALIIHKEL